MWLIPLLLIGLGFAVANRSDRNAPSRKPQLALPPPTPPSPINVLGEFVRVGQAPPPTVILCAIAEAEHFGRCDLATDIVRAFIAPVVYAHRAQNAPMSAPGMRAIAPPAPAQMLAMPAHVQERVYPPVRSQRGAPQRSVNGRGSCARPPARSCSPRAQTFATAAVSPTPAPVAPTRYVPSMEEIQRMMDTDPERAISALTLEVITKAVNDPSVLDRAAEASGIDNIANATGVPRDAMVQATQAAASNAAQHAAAQHAAAQYADVMMPSEIDDVTLDAVAFGIAKLFHTPINELVAKRDAHLANGPIDIDPNDHDHEPASATGPSYDEWYRLIGGPSGMPYNPPTEASPIAGISPDAWSHFRDLLVREPTSFDSPRHVGQYRQRRERLAELGFDPNSILGSADVQRAALDADLADAYRHAADEESRLVQDNVNHEITLPADATPHMVTLSGVLGVIQAAGLEGAVGWFEEPADRSRYPHTTQAFLRCNGVF
jgi:hypothetical protein